MAMQLCMVVNSGSMTPLDIDTSVISNGWGNNPPPSWAPCWQVMDLGNGKFQGIGWLPAPPYYGSSALPEIGVPFPPPAPHIS